MFMRHDNHSYQQRIKTEGVDSKHGYLCTGNTIVYETEWVLIARVDNKHGYICTSNTIVYETEGVLIARVDNKHGYICTSNKELAMKQKEYW